MMIMKRQYVMMQLRGIYSLLLILCLFAACDGGRMQRSQLEELEHMNRADSLMTNDSLARDLALWFDRYGTPNEQLRAYYILGRTYADRGEVPQALEAYHDAVNRADTTTTDCNYYTLCRVYSQMAVLFYRQNLINDNLRCLDQAIVYAYKANDTIAALLDYGLKANSFHQLNQMDSVISYSLKTAACPNIFYGYMSTASIAYIKKGDIENARKCLELYEQHSGYFDSLGNIEKGREVYYNIKGKYYLAINQLDSAEYYFHKELYNGRSYINQNMAARSLSLLYQQEGKTDSTAKYALYSYQMVDSVYTRMSTETVARMQAMFDYSRHQRMAQQEKERADREHQHFWNLVFYVIGSVIALLVLVGIVITVLQHKRKEALQHYYKKVEELNIAQDELNQLRRHESESEQFIHEKEQEILRLQSELDDSMRNIQLKHDKEKYLMEETGIAQLLRRKAATGTKLTNDEWETITQFVSKNLPEFDSFLSSKSDLLGLTKERICILLRLYVGVKNTGTMLGVSGPYISKVSGIIASDFFFIEGGGKELARKLSEY